MLYIIKCLTFLSFGLKKCSHLVLSLKFYFVHELTIFNLQSGGSVFEGQKFKAEYFHQAMENVDRTNEEKEFNYLF